MSPTFDNTSQQASEGPKKIQGTLKIVAVKVTNLPKGNGRAPSSYLVVKRDWYSINNTDSQYEVCKLLNPTLTAQVVKDTANPEWNPKGEEAKLSVSNL